MSKIGKLVSLALNNSNAAEASQALKAAAAAIQKEGLNPGHFLQKKDAKMEAELKEARKEIDQWQKKCQELEASRHHAASAAALAELREAKALVVKWHKTAQSYEPLIAKANAAAGSAQRDNARLRARLGIMRKGVVGLCAILMVMVYYFFSYKHYPPDMATAKAGDIAIHKPQTKQRIRASSANKSMPDSEVEQSIPYPERVRKRIYAQITSGTANYGKSCTIRLKIYPSGVVADVSPVAGNTDFCHLILRAAWHTAMPKPLPTQQKSMEYDGMIIKFSG